MPQLDALRLLTASCRYRRRLETPPARKHEAGYQARLIVPPQPVFAIPTPIQKGLSVEGWTPGGSLEWHLAAVWSFDLGRATMDAAAMLYPDREITLRQVCRVIAKREPGSG